MPPRPHSYSVIDEQNRVLLEEIRHFSQRLNDLLGMRDQTGELLFHVDDNVDELLTNDTENTPELKASLISYYHAFLFAIAGHLKERGYSYIQYPQLTEKVVVFQKYLANGREDGDKYAHLLLGSNPTPALYAKYIQGLKSFMQLCSKLEISISLTTGDPSEQKNRTTIPEVTREIPTINGETSGKVHRAVTSRNIKGIRPNPYKRTDIKPENPFD